MSSRLCPQCNTPFAGRSDKIYCSDDCRAEANQSKQRIAREPTVAINIILWKNREILRQLWNNRPTMIHWEQLISTGYNLRYHTSLHATNHHKIYFFCYDYGFQPCILQGSKMALVVKLMSTPPIDPWQLTRFPAGHMSG